MVINLCADTCTIPINDYDLMRNFSASGLIKLINFGKKIMDLKKFYKRFTPEELEEIYLIIGEIRKENSSLINFSDTIDYDKLPAFLAITLRSANIISWKQLSDYTKKDFYRLKNTGTRVFKAAMAELSKRNLFFKP
jgi:hypothetical protein